jgi:hypothetical protein
VHSLLEVLEVYVRVPCEGSLVDRLVFLPAKMCYLDMLKRDTGYRCE